MYNHALTWFETRVQFRRSAFWIGAVLLVVPTIIFLIAHRGRFATGMLGYAFFASLSLRMTLGLAEDRQAGHELLMSNFATPAERLAARFAAFLLREIAFFTLVWMLAAVATGSVTVMQAPPSCAFSSLIVPLCSSMIFFTIAKPRPVP